MISVERKKELVNEFGLHEKDTGSAQVQVAILTKEIEDFRSHFEKHPHDEHSKRGMLQKVNRRQKLLQYIKRHSEGEYKKIIKQLGLRK